ncbi:hypothetical protein [Shivajiella indica]|uniref:Beta-ketoacyl-[acyl-carrier-protein] synthase III N-terminal domain-containing protein n=1 Tax=Shivajiella indica TaxID=872115 RepID=A0ABW5B8J8_9BACT
MSLIIAKNIKISGMATTVPELSSIEAFESFLEVKVRRSPFEQTSSDLAFDAGQRIIENKGLDLDQVGALLFISRTPDYRSPNTAAVLQGRLGLSIDCACYDINKGSNGFQTGLVTAASILNAINKKYALVLFGDTPSKFNHEQTYFSKIDSDAGSAVLLEKVGEEHLEISSFHQSFGERFRDFAVPKGGFRGYNPSILFDSTDKDNFNLVFEREKIQGFLKSNLEKFKDEVEDFFPENSTRVFHSQLPLLGCTNQHESSLFVIKEFGNTYCSNIPLQLEFFAKQKSSGGNFAFSCVSFGEGLELSFIGFSIDALDILPTHVSNEFFEDFRVNHDM